MELQPLQTQSQKSHTKKWARKLLKTCTKNWCGEGDLNSRTTLKTRKLYTTRSSQNTRSARSTPPSHTTSHTGLPEPPLRRQNRRYDTTGTHPVVVNGVSRD